MSVVLVIPSRGRPERAWSAIAAANDLAVRADTAIILAIDADDPALEVYQSLRWHGPEPRDPFSCRSTPGVGPQLVVLRADETGDLVRATNTVSMRVARADPSCIIGNLGDDHMIRTPAWDRIVLEALASPGVAYGDDLVHGAALPTAPFISARFVLALGWYALPTCRHLFIDHAWKDIGEKTGTLRFLPELVTEHLHPLVGKAEWDDGYRDANSIVTSEHDWAAYCAWRDGPAEDDIGRCGTDA
jgi:hypothetical protein